MPSNIILKKSSVVTKVPLITDLEYGELALNYADGALYYKRSDNTIQNLTNASGGTVSRSTQTFTATSGQTIFSFSYTAGLLDVYLNGTKLVINDDFTASNGTSFTLTSAAALNDVIEAVTVASLAIADAVTLSTAQTISGTKTLSGVILNNGYTETVFAVTGTTPALSPTDGSIQTWTLTANSTPTAGTWAAGQSITLMINDSASSFTVTWTSLGVVWVGGSAPTLAPASGFTIIQLWKVGTTIYGALTGQVA